MAAPARPDPVLVLLAEWAAVRGLSREAVSRELGVARATVAGWFLGLEAHNEGRSAPRSAREFRFGSQRPDVQKRIAELLRRPVQALREESLGISSVPAGAAATTSAVSSGRGETQDLARTLIVDLAGGGLFRPGALTTTGSQRHRIAELVEQVDGVVATTVVAVPRGRVRSEPYQYQVIVHAAPPEMAAIGGGTAPEEYVRDLRRRVDIVLSEASYPCRWEHGAQRPPVEVESRGRRLVLVGSLICASLSGSQPPRRGVLVPPSGAEALVSEPRAAVVITNPYGGSGPVAGLLSRALGAGHLRSDEVVRSVRSVQSGSRAAGERGPFLSEDATHDAAFVLQLTLHLLGRGELPGAWVLSFEANLLDDGALRETVSTTESMLVVVRLGPDWRRLAAWRLAAARLNVGASAEPSCRNPVSSDWIDLGDGRELSDAERSVMAAQSEVAADFLRRLDRAEDRLEELVRARRELGLPTVDASLEEVPESLTVVEVGDGRVRTLQGVDRFAGPPKAVADDVDMMVDAWIDATAEVLDGVAGLTGHGSGRSLLDADSRDPWVLALKHGAEVPVR